MQARARLGRPQHRVLGAGGTPSHGLQPCSAHGRNVNSGGELQGGREWSQLCTAATLTRFGAGSGPGTVAGALGPVGAPLSELTLNREHYIPSLSTAEMSTLEGTRGAHFEVPETAGGNGDGACGWIQPQYTMGEGAGLVARLCDATLGKADVSTAPQAGAPPPPRHKLS